MTVAEPPAPSAKLLASLEAHRAQGTPFAKLAELHENPRNPKTDHDVRRIVASLQAFGWGRPVAYRRATGELEAGHGTTLAARSLGLEEVPAVALEHDEGEALGYAIADNKTAEGSRWREDVLAEELARRDAATFDALGFDPGEAERILALVRSSDDLPPTPRRKKKNKPDETVKPTATAELGDLWILGSHRLAVGDCFGAATRRALLEGEAVPLVFTDPPFAIYGSSSGIGADIADDRMVRPFFRRLAQIIAEETRIWGHVYVCCDWRSWPAVYDSFRNRLAPKNLVVWDKGGGGLGSTYANTYELVGFFARLPPPKTMRSTEERGQRQVYAPNLVRVNRASGEARNHNAAKPVDLVSIFLENSSDPGDVVLDLFGGGGSTLEAAERTGRRARLVEINPDNADKIIERWAKLTGGTPTRIPNAFDPGADAELEGGADDDAG